MHINIQIPEKSSNKVDRRSPAPVEETTILKSEQNHGDILPYYINWLSSWISEPSTEAFSPPKKTPFFWRCFTLHQW